MILFFQPLASGSHTGTAAVCHTPTPSHLTPTPSHLTPTPSHLIHTKAHPLTDTPSLSTPHHTPLTHLPDHTPLLLLNKPSFYCEEPELCGVVWRTDVGAWRCQSSHWDSERRREEDTARPTCPLAALLDRCYLTSVAMPRIRKDDFLHQ